MQRAAAVVVVLFPLISPQLHDFAWKKCCSWPNLQCCNESRATLCGRNIFWILLSVALGELGIETTYRNRVQVNVIKFYNFTFTLKNIASFFVISRPGNFFRRWKKMFCRIFQKIGLALLNRSPLYEESMNGHVSVVLCSISRSNDFPLFNCAKHKLHTHVDVHTYICAYTLFTTGTIDRDSVINTELVYAFPREFTSVSCELEIPENTRQVSFVKRGFIEKPSFINWNNSIVRNKYFSSWKVAFTTILTRWLLYRFLKP